MEQGKQEQRSVSKVSSARGGAGDTYIVPHPHDAQQVAIATFARSVFLSHDRGMTWKQIADRGRTL